MAIFVLFKILFLHNNKLSLIRISYPYQAYIFIQLFCLPTQFDLG